MSITAAELHFLGCIMANPQPDKFTKISNELLDALAKIRIAGEARQMLDVIIRKTYGFNKKIDTIPTSQFIKFTNLSRMAIHKAREKLLKMNLITITKKGNSQVLNYSIQKDYNKWKPLPKKVTVTKKGNSTITQKGNPLLPKKVTTSTKDTLSKETIQKKERFLELWNKYPNKDGKTQAYKHFNSSVKTKEDWLAINTALTNYLKSERVNNGYVKNGSTWFNNWRDWVDYIEPSKPQQTKKGELEEL